MKLLKALWAVLFAFGVVGVAQRLMFGHHLAAYGSYVPWGLWVSAYIYFMGMSAGAFFLSSLVYVFRVKALEKVGPLTLVLALVTLVMGLVVVWFDLGHMMRIWRVFVTPSFSSMMAWMMWLYSAYFILLSVETRLVLRPAMVRCAGGSAGGVCGHACRRLLFGQTDLSEERLNRDRRIVQTLAVIGIPLAIGFSGGVGALFGVVGARPFWHSALFPILFLGSALASGSALLTAAVAFFWKQRDADWQALVTLLGRMTLGLLALYVLLEWAEVSITVWGSIPAHVEGFKLMLFGPFWWVFWLVHVGLGVVVPMALLVARPRIPAVVGTAAGLIAVTFLSVRLNIVIPGLAYSELRGLGEAFHHSRLSFDYFPTTHEWLVLLFVVTFGIALFYAALHYLPVTEPEAEPSLILPEEVRHDLRPQPTA